MLEQVMNANYTAADCAFALQHGNFGRFRRDITRSKGLFFPRKTARGYGGGEYRYAHLVEMGIHLAMVRRGTSLAKQVVGGLARMLQGSGYGLDKIHALDEAERSEIANSVARFIDEDFPEDVPRDTTWLVDYPSYYFGEDFISRDPAKPTYLIYNPTHGDNRVSTEVRFIGEMTLSEAREQVHEMLCANIAEDDWRLREAMDESCDDLPILNLTTILARIDRRLDLRLQATSIRGV